MIEEGSFVNTNEHHTGIKDMKDTSKEGSFVNTNEDHTGIQDMKSMS